MYWYSYLTVLVFIPLSSIQHFIEPLSNCLLADLCNHTWIPECGEKDADDFRLFIDSCDMYEFNCDKNKSYVIANYSECFRPFTGCPTLKQFYRIGDYKYMLEGRQIVYAPSHHHRYATYNPTTTTRITFSTRPHGKRRYTPEARKLRQQLARRKLASEKVRTTKGGCPYPFGCPTKGVLTTKPKQYKRVLTTKRILTTTNGRTTLLGTVILKKIMVEKNGTKFYKVIKGYPTTTMKYDSDFLE